MKDFECISEWMSGRGERQSEEKREEESAGAPSAAP